MLAEEPHMKDSLPVVVLAHQLGQSGILDISSGSLALTPSEHTKLPKAELPYVREEQHTVVGVA